VVVSESFIRLIWFMMSEIAMFYVFRKKWGFVWSYVCWSMLIQSNYGGVAIVGCEFDLCINDMTWFKCVVCLILINDLLIYQWNPNFFLSFINTRKIFFFENKCLFKYFKSIIYCPIFLKYVLIYRRNSMCFFSHFLNTRKNVSFV